MVHFLTVTKKATSWTNVMVTIVNLSLEEIYHMLLEKDKMIIDSSDVGKQP